MAAASAVICSAVIIPGMPAIPDELVDMSIPPVCPCPCRRCPMSIPPVPMPMPPVLIAASQACSQPVISSISGACAASIFPARSFTAWLAARSGAS